MTSRLHSFSKANSLIRLIAVALLLPVAGLTGPFSAHAENSAATNTKRDLAYAKRSFQDGLYDVAASRLKTFLEEYPQSNYSLEARWLLGQSYYFLEKYPEALRIFQTKKADISDETFHPKFRFWEAETLAALKRWPAASRLYRDIIKVYSGTEWEPLSRLSLASALYAAGKSAEALKELDTLENQKDQEDPELVLKAKIRKVKIHLAERHIDEAAKLIQQLSGENLRPPLRFEAKFWEGELGLLRESYEEALTAFTSVTSDPRAFPRELVAQSWFGRGQALLKQEKWTEASQAFEKVFSISRSPSRIETAVNCFLETETKNNNLTFAASKIREFIGKQKHPPIAGLYAIARYYLEKNNPDAAVAELDHLIEQFADSEWLWPARLLKAKALLQKNEKSKDSLELLNAVAKQKESPEMAVKAELLLAEMKMNKGDFVPAAEIYLRAAAKTADPSLSEEAICQAARGYAQANDIPHFEETLASLDKKFPDSPLRPPLTLMHGKLLDAQAKSKAARKIYKTVIDHAASLELVADAKFLLGRSYWAEASYPEAARIFSDLEKDHPSFPEMAQVIYLRILAQTRGNLTSPEQARSGLEDLQKRYPDHPLLPKIAFQIAQSFFNEQKLDQAQEGFQKIVDQFPDLPLSNKALYQVGKCALKLGNYAEAIASLEKIPQDSPIKPDARLAQIRCYMLQGSYEDALLIADTLVKSRKDQDYIWIEATLRQANCLFLLASKKDVYYEKALTTVEKILACDHASIARKNEAGYLKGKIEQTKGNIPKALNAFMDVVYGRFLPAGVTQQPSQPDYVWFTRSGIEAAQIKEDTEDIKGAVAIYRILEKLGGPNREGFRKKIEELKSRYFIWEET